MYSFLRGEMIRNRITVTGLAKQIGVSEKTLRNKLGGETDFTWSEALAIRKIVNPAMSMEDLFTSDDEKPEMRFAEN